MVTFFIALAVLIGGYFLYGKFVDSIIPPDDRPTPALTKTDGVDFVPMSTPKVFLIQLLNIAGLGPIFGAISGALWGPIVYFWIVLGTILAGGVHDYMSGMMSMRHEGASIAEIVGIYLGNAMKNVMRVFSVVLLVLVGTVFATGPAGLLAKLTPESLDAKFWLVVVLAYYFLATVVPVDKLIGKIYPFFGACLIFMAIGVISCIIAQGYALPEMQLANLHPAGTPVWAMMFVTVACGAISGFHATQSPMMARCTKSEREGRKIFYGAMVSEGIIALIWAAAGVAFYQTTGGLSAALKEFGGAGGVVYDICFGLMGGFGGIIAMVGVIACPITSGDTAFRSARLTIADWFGIEQLSIKNRLLLAIPLLGIGAALSQIDFNVVWRYFSWSNQTLAMIVLWTGAAFLNKLGRKNLHWVCAAPATFMTAVSATYLMMAPECFKLPTSIAYPVGIVAAVVALGVYLRYISRLAKETTKA